MLIINKITQSVTNISAKDPELKIFDIVMETKFGTTYNSYLVDGGEELALIDTAKEKYTQEYLNKLNEICDINKIKYLIVNHTEPDHSGEIHNILEKMPWLTIIGTSTALGFLKDIANKEFNSIEVKEGLRINVGNKNFSFVIAPNLHWPDSMFTYLEEEKVLFTCDMFGSHYCCNETFANEVPNKEDYMEAFKYYYDAIFGPFKPYVISGIEKAKKHEIHTIAPSHGPVIKTDIEKYMEIYLNWSKETEVNKNKITVAYTSAYGYTEKVAQEISKAIGEQGFEVTMLDMIEEPIESAVAHINSSYAFLIGSPTLNADTLPNIWNLMLSLSPYKCNGKLAAGFGIYGWSGEAVRNIESRLSMIKCEVYRPGIRIRFNPEDESKLKKAYSFGEQFAKKARKLQERDNEEWVEVKSGKWMCLICGEIFEGEYPPKTCPACGAPEDQFIEVKDEICNFKSDNVEKIIVIGSGIAALSAIEAIRERNTKSEIEMISEEEELPYYRILLSKKILSQNLHTKIKDETWFDENNIKVTFGKKVFRIIPDQNKIIFQDGTFADYTKLIIATGASSNKPEVHGNDKEGVFTLRNKKDFDKINEYAQREKVNKIVILGGGILGIEMASSLKKSGKEIEIIECSPRLMIRQLDEDGSKMLKKHLEDNNVKVRLGEAIEEIYGTGEGFRKTCGALLAHSKEKINCEMIIMSCGIKPNVELVVDSGINTNKGILVDNHMRTNFENIYACGDVAEYEGKIMGLWNVAISQGKVSGANCVGDNKPFIIRPISTSFNGFDYNIFSIGDLGNNPEVDYQILELSDPKMEIYRKFYFEDNQFVGGILMGDTKKAVQLRKAIDKGTNMQTFLDAHFLDE